MYTNNVVTDTFTIPNSTTYTTDGTASGYVIWTDTGTAGGIQPIPQSLGNNVLDWYPVCPFCHKTHAMPENPRQLAKFCDAIVSIRKQHKTGNFIIQLLPPEKIKMIDFLREILT